MSDKAETQRLMTKNEPITGAQIRDLQLSLKVLEDAGWKHDPNLDLMVPPNWKPNG